jgi:hypothetical protein
MVADEHTAFPCHVAAIAVAADSRRVCVHLHHLDMLALG